LGWTASAADHRPGTGRRRSHRSPQHSVTGGGWGFWSSSGPGRPEQHPFSANRERSRPVPKNGLIAHANASGAIDADEGFAGSGREPAAVLDQKAACAGELVGSLRDDRHGEFLGGQVPAGQLHTFPGVALVEIHDGGLLVGPGRGQGVQGFGVGFVLEGAPAWCVVIGCSRHLIPAKTPCCPVMSSILAAKVQHTNIEAPESVGLSRPGRRVHQPGDRSETTTAAARPPRR